MPCDASCIQQQSTERIGGKKLNSLIMHTTWQFSCLSEAWGSVGPTFWACHMAATILQFHPVHI